MWNEGNYIDLGANTGDSIAWFYNVGVKNIKYSVPYPKFNHNIINKFSTYIFEANPFLCKKIHKVIKMIKRETKLNNFYVYCPVIVSTYDGEDVMSIDNNDIYSSKYYSAESMMKRIRKNYTLPVVNFTKFLTENININDFNVMKFDIEGEEHFIMPKLIENKLLALFDVLYSEFHTGSINNPVKSKAKDNYNAFLNFTRYYTIDAYEERKIDIGQINHYNDIYNNLKICRHQFFE